MKQFWRFLDAVALADDHLPHFLISATFEADSYTIYLTDLTNIWIESLDHAAILLRAEEQNTSIDPTDASQLHILLRKLGSALSSDPKSKLSLHIDDISGRVRPGITLNLSIELPGGLAPLEWAINLAAAPQSVLMSQLTMPLIQAQHGRVREIESLKEVVKEKDHVIQRLMDKIETHGIDLVQVFPQAITKGGRKVDKARVEEKVQGLRQFDIEAWKKDLTDDWPTNTAQLLQNVFTGDTDVCQEIGTSTFEENWWARIKNVVETTRSKPPTAPAPMRKDSTQDDDGFQVQSLPAYHTGAPSKTSQRIAQDDSTNEEDLDASSPTSRVQNKFPALSHARMSHSRPAKFGIVGGKKEPVNVLASSPAADESTDDEEPSVSKSARQKGKLGEDDNPRQTTDSTSDEDLRRQPTQIGAPGNLGEKKSVEMKALPSLPYANKTTTMDDEGTPSPPRRPTPEPKKGTVGRVGGKKEAPPPPSSSLSPSSSPPRVEAPKHKKGKLGQIGGKKKPTPAASQHLSQQLSQQDKTTSHTPAKKRLDTTGDWSKTSGENGALDADEEVRGRLTVHGKEQTPPREPSEERAEKKRQELKRELEEKAKAPVKKKRKF